MPMAGGGVKYGEEEHSCESKLSCLRKICQTCTKQSEKRMLLCSINITFLKNKRDDSWNSDKKVSSSQVS